MRHAQIALGHAAALFVGQHPALGIDELRADAEEGAPRASRLHRVRAGQGGDHDAAGLCLPPGIDDGDAALADGVVIPAPCLGVDRLANAAEQAQRRQVMAGHIMIALAHQRADRSEEHTSELQSLMRISYAVFCLKKKKQKHKHSRTTYKNKNMK